MNAAVPSDLASGGNTSVADSASASSAPSESSKSSASPPPSLPLSSICWHGSVPFRTPEQYFPGCFGGDLVFNALPTGEIRKHANRGQYRKQSTSVLHACCGAQKSPKQKQHKEQHTFNGVHERRRSMCERALRQPLTQHAKRRHRTPNNRPVVLIRDCSKQQRQRLTQRCRSGRRERRSWAGGGPGRGPIRLRWQGLVNADHDAAECFEGLAVWVRVQAICTSNTSVVRQPQKYPKFFLCPSRKLKPTNMNCYIYRIYF